MWVVGRSRLGLDHDGFWSLTPAQFQLLEADYWDKMELQESFTAIIVAQMQTLWVNQNLQKGQTPKVFEPQQFMVTVARKARPGWVKTVNGWIREEELAASQHRVQVAAQGNDNG